MDEQPGTSARGRTALAKRALRSEILATRREMGSAARETAAGAITAALLDHPWLVRAQTVSAYASIGTEPGTRALLDQLLEQGSTVLLPVLLADADLSWAPYEGPASLAPGEGSQPEPSGLRLEVETVREADVVIVPALAADAHGMRLGRGGGSYDRVLARLGGDTRTLVPLYDGEVVAAVPAEPHDQRVRAVVTPSIGVRELRPA